MKIRHFNDGTHSFQGELIENRNCVNRPVKSVVDIVYGILEIIKYTAACERMSTLRGVIPHQYCAGQRVDLPNHQAEDQARWPALVEVVLQ